MKLSVIISNRNDLAMLSVTVRSCLEEFKAIDGPCEVVISDNSDRHIFAQLRSVLPVRCIKEGQISILRQDFPCLFSAREQAIQAAKSPYVVCLDSHMLCGRDMLKDLLHFMEQQADPLIGFAHAPISWCHQHPCHAKHDRDMSTCELGNWGNAYPSNRLITWKGMPWICKREWFLSKEGLGGYGALSQHKLSWGGGDMHIGIKPWLLGYKNYAIPCSPGIHIGPFPKTDIPADDPNSAIAGSPGDGYRYRVWSNSGCGPHAVGFLVSCYVLGGEPMMQRNKKPLQERFGRYINIEEWWSKAKAYGKDEKAWLDERKKLTFEQLLETRPWND
jgi:hypothetical protein